MTHTLPLHYTAVPQETPRERPGQTQHAQAGSLAQMSAQFEALSLQFSGVRNFNAAATEVNQATPARSTSTTEAEAAKQAARTNALQTQLASVREAPANNPTPQS